MTATWDQNSFSALDGAGRHLERETLAWPRGLFGMNSRTTWADTRRIIAALRSVTSDW